MIHDASFFTGKRPHWEVWQSSFIIKSPSAAFEISLWFDYFVIVALPVFSSSYSLYKKVLVDMPSKNFTKPARECDECSSCIEPAKVPVDLCSNRANDSSQTRGLEHRSSTREHRRLRAAASDTALQTSYYCKNGHDRKKKSESKLPYCCSSCNLSEELHNVPRDTGYAYHRVLHDSPYDQPWSVQSRLHSCKDNTTNTARLDAGHQDLGNPRRSLPSTNFHMDGVLAGVGSWAKDTHTWVMHYVFFLQA